VITTNVHEQWIGCTVCQELYEIPRRLLRDQHDLVEMVDEIKHDHRECAADPDNPKLAAANRAFRKAVEREFARSAA
jgi:hypothetical protein